MTDSSSANATMRFAKPTLFASVAAVGFAQTVLFAILAPLGREVGLVEMQIGAIISASSLTVFLASPMWGRTSDRWGRKKVILVGLFGYSVGSTLFAGVFQIALWGLLVPMAAFIGLTLARISNAVCNGGGNAGPLPLIWPILRTCLRAPKASAQWAPRAISAPCWAPQWGASWRASHC